MNHSQCIGVTLKKLKCKHIAKYNGYCIQHATQHIQLTNDIWSYIIKLFNESLYKRYSVYHGGDSHGSRRKCCVIFCVVSKSFNHTMNELVKPYWFKYLRPQNNELLTDAALSVIASAVNELDLFCNDYITDRGLKQLTNLTSLKLGYNYTITNDGIRKLTNLKDLGLIRNQKITNLGIFPLINLTSLDLSGNENISDLGLMNLTKLSTLLLGNSILITDKSITNLTNLTDLRLNHTTGITNDGIGSLTNLTSLAVTNQRTITSYGLMTLTNLTKLTLINSPIISVDLSHLTNIKNIIEIPYL